jgi:glycolate oxidase FAD binding subunit
MAGNTSGTDVTTSVETDAGSIQDLVLEATAAKTPLRIAGRSHWIDAGRPVNATRIASLAAHTGVVDYVPGDLTITVRSGTTLSAIEDVTRAEGQWLPLDPYGSKDGTIGATIATGSFGPLAHAFGRARDLVLGVEFVTGDGHIVRGGGRVVKNVAGFDLVRLITGSWGTIGVITEATLRLYSMHSHPVTLSLAAPDGAAALATRIASILAATATAFAVELVDAGLADRLGLSRQPQVLVELGGNAPGVAAQKDTLAALGGVREIDPRVWNRLRSVDEMTSMTEGDAKAPPIVVRISSLPARVAELWVNARDVLVEVDGALMHATPGFGIVRCILPGNAPHSLIQRLASSSRNVTVTYERLPAAMWDILSPSVVSDRVSQGIKRAFDPQTILNPGIMGPAS